MLQNEANKIKKEAADLDRLIDQKLKDYEDLREDMRGKEHEVKNLLEKGKAEQQVSLTCRWLHFLRRQFKLLRWEPSVSSAWPLRTLQSLGCDCEGACLLVAKSDPGRFVL